MKNLQPESLSESVLEYGDCGCGTDAEYDEHDEGVIISHSCRPGEGPPAALPDPEGRGLHPLVYRGTSRRRSRNPTVGDAQQLLNQFLSELSAGAPRCKPGADLVTIGRLRATLSQDPLAVDCRFGPNTETVTKMFQRCVFPGAPTEWDGKIGPRTWAELALLRVPATPVPPAPPITPPPVPTEVNKIIGEVKKILGRLPLGRLGIVLPTSARFLTAAEKTEARTIYKSSLDFSTVVITDGLGGSGRAFTTAVPTSAGMFVAMNMGPGPFSTPLSDKRLLIHELAHAWQSQHHSDPTQFMINSAGSQAQAFADLPLAKADAAASAVASAVASGTLDPGTLASIGQAAGAAENTSSYAYVPGKAFGEYAAEQIAEQVEHTYLGIRSPTPAIVPHIQSVAVNAVDTDNETSLATFRHERSSTPGVVFP